MEYYNEKPKKDNFIFKFAILLIIILIILVLLNVFLFKNAKTKDEKYDVLKEKLCIAAKEYIKENQDILNSSEVGKSTHIKYKTLAEHNLIAAKLENPYYDGGLFKTATQPKYYSMENSVRLVVQTDGNYYCELVENSNDVTAPVLQLKGNRQITLAVGTELEDPGYIAIDDYDGDISDKVVRSGNVNSSKPGIYTITYTSSDSAGNIVTENRDIIYKEYNDIEITTGSILDEVKPEISLRGANPYCLEKGNKYIEPGAVAIDNVDGDITNRLSINSKVTGNLIGTFRVTYKVMDNAGNESVAYRSVVVSTSCSGSNKEEVSNTVNQSPSLTLVGKKSKKNIVNVDEYNLDFKPENKTISQNFKKSPKIGLQNIGATCYMNSTLQCFCHISKFVEFFKYNSYAIDDIRKDKEKKTLTSSFRLLIENLWPNNHITTNKYYSPNEFKDKISKLNPLFEGKAANDSKDLINLIIMKLHEELNQIKQNNKRNNFQKMAQDQKNGELMYHNFKNSFYKNNKSIIKDLFYGINSSKARCLNCSNISYNYYIYTFLVFSLEEVLKYKTNKYTIFYQKILKWLNRKLAFI